MDVETHDGENTAGVETMSERTYDDTCPWCGRLIKDIWDFGWGHSNFTEGECPHCNRSITIESEVSYVISQGKDATND